MGRPSNDNNPEAEQFRKLFIGGLDYRTTDQSLKSFYEQWGEIVDVVVMKHPQTQKSRGFGFVTYAQSSMVDEAMKNRPHKIDGREVDSKRAVPRDESGVQTNANVNVKKMFVGGLKEQTEAELRAYFGSFGNIVGINIVMDKQTGKRKGYAFIEFDDYDPVDKALLRKDHTIGGKSVTVKKAVVKEASGAPGGRSGGGGGSGGGSSGGAQRGSRGGRGPAVNTWSGGNQWGGGANGYGGPWDSQPQGNGWGPQWDQYGGGGWNANGYQSYGGGGGGGGGAGTGGGPMRNNYSGQNRSAPYGGDRVSD
ncbi:heterogeneous nuclear ribonucleoprotein 87F isoform X2 [Halyomorpha halys]|uniref:heterogeneous nuclear ribonucleoprotein 87F isoform X2 n=1 Tax=Halyomorpha halys TaxID=286706 RepID=UPI0006D4DD91|nr:heterogeneous nuclear ribonucleoprotein 87F-like isoform X2 [Halyomorpha halys]